MTTRPQTLLRSDFRERAKANDVPIARLVGFEAEKIGEAALWSPWLPAAARESHGHTARRHSLRHRGCRKGDGVYKHVGSRRILHDNRVEDEFLPAGLAGST